MEITLKNVKHSEWASQETQCFSATVYVDGKRTATVENDGHGGATLIRPLRAEAKERLAAAEEYAASLPKWRLGDGYEIDMDFESLIDHLLTEWLWMRDFKRWEKKNACFWVRGEFYKARALYTEEIRNQILEKHPDAMFVHDYVEHGDLADLRERLCGYQW